MDNLDSMSDYTHLLNEDCHFQDDILEKYNSRRARKKTPCTQVLTYVVILLLACNATLLLVQLLERHAQQDGSILWPKNPDGQDFSYFGSPQTVMTSFSHDWVGLHAQENETYKYRDEQWGDSLFPDSGGSVALSAEFIRKYNLPENAAPTPADPNKKIYMVAGYHQLHCLDILRTSIYYLNGTLSEWPDEDGFIWDHVLHCIEAVRLGLTCFLDPTLINLNETWPGIPNGQRHQCRNREALYNFVTEHGHPIPNMDSERPPQGSSSHRREGLTDAQYSSTSGINSNNTNTPITASIFSL